MSCLPALLKKGYVWGEGMKSEGNPLSTSATGFGFQMFSWGIRLLFTEVERNQGCATVKETISPCATRSWPSGQPHGTPHPGLRQQPNSRLNHLSWEPSVCYWTRHLLHLTPHLPTPTYNPSTKLQARRG